MTLNRMTQIILIAFFATALISCGHGRKVAANTHATSTTAAESTDAQVYGIGEKPQFTGEELQAQLNQDKQKNLLSQREVHFAFDSNEVTALDKEAVEAHAHYLLDNPDINLRIEGFTDERGSSEYNIALGERRGQAVAKILYAFGISHARISLVSYGEERPVDVHHNETAWQKNRRAVLVYG